MKLYGFPLSPFVRKVALVLAEKELEFEWEPSNPGRPTDEFREISPFCKIPGFRDGDFTLADSTAIATYLDAKYPQSPVLPADPERRGRAVWFEEVVDTVLVPSGAPIVQNRFLRPVIFQQPGDETAAMAAEEALEKPLAYLEGQLGEGDWLDGEFSLADIALASALKTLVYASFILGADRHPNLTAWYERIQGRPAWQKVAMREAHTFAALSTR